MTDIYRKVCTGVSFSKGKPVLDIFCRDSDNRRVVAKVFDLPCYFYVDENEEIEESDRKTSVLAEQYGYTSIFGRKLKRLRVKKISEVRKLGKIYHGYESDMKWDKKCLLDLKITDKFVYHNGKAFTLDSRFNALIDRDEEIITDDGVSISRVIKSQADVELIAGAMNEDKLLSGNIPKIGHEAFEVRHVVLDIEVVVDRREDLSSYMGEIVCIVLWDSYLEEFFKFKLDEKTYGVGAEKQMLIQALEKLKELDVDLITGWNVAFDINWIINKAGDYSLDLSVYFPGGQTFVTKYTDPNGKYHEDIHIGGRIMLDGLELYKKKTITTEKLNSYSLKSVAMVEGLKEWEDLGRRVKELWEEDPDRVVEYCKLDVERTMEIIKKKRLLSNALTICKFYGCGFNEVTVNSKVIESMMFLLKRSRVLPNIVRGRAKANVVGAVVLDTVPGLHKNVGIFDAASLYPSIISGLNISPECLSETAKADTVSVPLDKQHYIYKTDCKLGLMTEVISEMRKLREEIRANRAAATKVGDKEMYKLYTDDEKVAKGVLASVYGVMAFSEFRLFNEECANIITGIARKIIELIIKKVECDEYHVIAGDTDSVFIRTYSVDYAFLIADKINEIVNEYMDTFGVKHGVIKVNFEKFFKWILFSKKVAPKRKGKLWKKDTGSAKKRYIGFISHVESGPREMKEVNELYYRGFELRRSDSAQVLKDVMRQFFYLMEDGNYKNAVEYIKSIHKQFKSYEKDYVAMPRSVNVEEANNPWANGVRYAKKNLNFEFDSDQMPKLIYVKDQRKYPKTDVICYQDGHVIPSEFQIDHDVMFNKLIKAKFEPIFESLGMYWDTQIGAQSSLDAFA